jgi:hypothetical protein
MPVIPRSGKAWFPEPGSFWTGQLGGAGPATSRRADARVAVF